MFPTLVSAARLRAHQFRALTGAAALASLVALVPMTASAAPAPGPPVPASSQPPTTPHTTIVPPGGVTLINPIPPVPTPPPTPLGLWVNPAQIDRYSAGVEFQQTAGVTSYRIAAVSPTWSGLATRSKEIPATAAPVGQLIHDWIGGLTFFTSYTLQVSVCAPSPFPDIQAPNPEWCSAPAMVGFTTADWPPPAGLYVTGVSATAIAVEWTGPYPSCGSMTCFLGFNPYRVR